MRMFSVAFHCMSFSWRFYQKHLPISAFNIYERQFRVQATDLLVGGQPLYPSATARVKLLSYISCARINLRVLEHFRANTESPYMHLVYVHQLEHIQYRVLCIRAENIHQEKERERIEEWEKECTRVGEAKCTSENICIHQRQCVGEEEPINMYLTLLCSVFHFCRGWRKFSITTTEACSTRDKIYLHLRGGK